VRAPGSSDGTTTVQLADGRQLGYAELGPSDGSPVFFFHCSPGSRLQCPDPDLPERLGVRFVTVDRPGYGLSDPKPGRRLIEWPHDVAALADHLGISEFAVCGWSGGAPHALVCAALLAERTSAIGVVACPAPFEACPGKLDDDPVRARLHEAVKSDALGAEQSVVEFYRRFAEDPDAWYQEQLTESPDGVVGRLDWDANFRSSVAEGLRSGVAGYASDALAVIGPWGFNLSDVRLPVSLWQGTDDALVDRRDFDYLAGALRGARPALWDGEGHAAAYSRFGEFLSALVDRPAPSSA
jgi:pimeloyl-ACP methyl ester carboxylesterase